jgi:hypothetical protein
MGNAIVGDGEVESEVGGTAREVPGQADVDHVVSGPENLGVLDLRRIGVRGSRPDPPGANFGGPVVRLAFVDDGGVLREESATVDSTSRAASSSKYRLTTG